MRSLRVLAASAGWDLFAFSRMALRALTQFPEAFEGVNPRVMSIAPGDLIGVVTDRRHGHWSEWHQFIGLQDPKRILGLGTFLTTTGTRAVVAQMLPAIDAAVTVLPLDNQAVCTLL